MSKILIDLLNIYLNVVFMVLTGFAFLDLGFKVSIYIDHFESCWS